MKLSDLKNSRFLTKADLSQPILATISHVEQTNVAPANEQAQMKWTLHFMEPGLKPMVLNSTNGETIAEITGSDDSEQWTGTKLVLYHEPNVMMGPKKVGGIRIRAPQAPAAPETPQAPIPRATPPTAAMPAEDIPW